jgi:hypothetical protein
MIIIDPYTEKEGRKWGEIARWGNIGYIKIGRGDCNVCRLCYTLSLVRECAIVIPHTHQAAVRCMRATCIHTTRSLSPVRQKPLHRVPSHDDSARVAYSSGALKLVAGLVLHGTHTLASLCLVLQL